MPEFSKLAPGKRLQFPPITTAQAETFRLGQTAARFIEVAYYLNNGIRLVDHLPEIQKAWQMRAQECCPDVPSNLIAETLDTPRCVRLFQDLEVNYTLFSNLESRGQILLRLNSIPSEKPGSTVMLYGLPGIAIKLPSYLDTNPTSIQYTRFMTTLRELNATIELSRAQCDEILEHVFKCEYLGAGAKRYNHVLAEILREGDSYWAAHPSKSDAPGTRYLMIIPPQCLNYSFYVHSCKTLNVRHQPSSEQVFEGAKWLFTNFVDLKGLPVDEALAKFLPHNLVLYHTAVEAVHRLYMEDLKRDLDGYVTWDVNDLMILPREMALTSLVDISSPENYVQPLVRFPLTKHLKCSVAPSGPNSSKYIPPRSHFNHIFGLINTRVHPSKGDDIVYASGVQLWETVKEVDYLWQWDMKDTKAPALGNHGGYIINGMHEPLTSSLTTDTPQPAFTISPGYHRKRIAAEKALGKRLFLKKKKRVIREAEAMKTREEAARNSEEARKRTEEARKRTEEARKQTEEALKLQAEAASFMDEAAALEADAATMLED